MSTSVPKGQPEAGPPHRKPKFRNRHRVRREPVRGSHEVPTAPRMVEATVEDVQESSSLVEPSHTIPVEEIAPVGARRITPAPPAARLRLRPLTVAEGVFILIVFGAFMLRIWNVGARAMHLDESTVAWYAWQLLTGHGYAYDPVYHGPFQHEMLALLFMLFQPSETTARLLAVVLGTVLVALPWFIRDYLGRAGALIASLLLAISPSFVYFARFERDDTYMEFFTFLLVVFALRYVRDKRPWQLYGGAIAFALAFATKESIYIVAFIFISFVVLWVIGVWLGAKRREWISQLAPDGRLTRPLLLGFAVAFVLAFAVTVVKGTYPPVPVVGALLMIAVVIGCGSAYALRNPGAPLMFIRSVPRSLWLNAFTIAVAIDVLMYSTFGTNLNGLWDHAHPLFNTHHVCPYALAFNLDACRRDMLGGLFYWLSQHKVARGGQPWYYYTLLFGLYEQIALLFGAFALVRTLVRPASQPGASTFRVFIVYWAVLAYGVYSWAGEKFPWLGIHPLLPLTILAALGIRDLFLLRPAIPAMLRYAAAGVLGLLLVAEVHNTYELNYVNGANPVEMMVYVQSAPDTVSDAHLIEHLSYQATNGADLAVTIDSQDAWPFAWYLRNMPNVAYPAGAAVTKPPFVNNPVVIVDESDAVDLPTSLTHGYSATLHRLDWWFPEDYKAWTWSTFGHLAIKPSSWRAIWNWETVRTPFGPRDGTWYYLYIRKGYFSPY